MIDILLVGNPNVGKTTIFNKLTKSRARIGNWNGVTVEAKKATISIEGQTVNVWDLPGIYSLNPYSIEENVSVKTIKDNPQAVIFYVVSSDTFIKSVYLYEQLKTLPNKVVVLFNIFNKQKFDIKKDVESLFDTNFVYFIKDKKIKIGDFKNIVYSDGLTNKNTTSKNAESKYVLEKLKKLQFQSKNDNFLTKIISNKWILLFFSLIYFIFSFFITFSSVGEFFTEIFSDCLYLIANLFINKININNIFLNNFLLNGIISPIISIISFIPQIFLLNFFIKTYEETGLLSRLAFYIDDIFSFFGLNGRSLYTLLMGFGCCSVATTTSNSNMDENVKIRTCAILPCMSCSAKLPIYVAICSVFFKNFSFGIIVLLYALGILTGLIISKFFQKGMNDKNKRNFIMEVTEISMPDFKMVIADSVLSVVKFITKIFKYVAVVGMFVWLSTHLSTSFCFTMDISSSILYKICSFISFIFAPIGLNNPAIVLTLIVGIMAKELILTTLVTLNSTTLSGLGASLLSGNSVVSFTSASALSFLTFVLLYMPCVSNLSVIKKEVPKRTFYEIGLTYSVVPYIVSMFIYSLASLDIVRNIVLFVLAFGVLLLISINDSKHKNCKNCKKCLKR